MKILIWNINWAKPNSKREKIIKEIITNASPDIICITEGYLESWQDVGYMISSEEDYGYKIHKGRRKVILISKTPWINIDNANQTKMPSGRYISGTINNINIIGVCIPWKDSHVRTGQKNKKVWEEHIAYLKALQKKLSELTKPTLVMGDFNQRIPRKYSRKDVYELLLKTFENMNFATKGNIQPINKQTIDHLCTTIEIKVSSIKSIDNIQNSIRLSDHFGLIVTLDILTNT